MKWTWKGIEPTLETIQSASGDISIDSTSITRLEPDKGTHVLGVRMAMNGSFKDELEYRISQSVTMGLKLYKSWLSPIDACMVYETCFRPALEYSLMITTFSKCHLDQIQKPFVHLLLPKIGLNRHMPRAVIYGPVFRGGLGIVKLEEQQIIKHFSAFQCHLRLQDNIKLNTLMVIQPCSLPTQLLRTYSHKLTKKAICMSYLMLSSTIESMAQNSNRRMQSSLLPMEVAAASVPLKDGRSYSNGRMGPHHGKL
jgi:hypothetical protein